MATFSNIGLEEASTITNRVATVQINRGGTAEDQEIMVIGGAESSLEIARVVGATPDSTHFGLVVREAAPTTSVRVHQSSAADLNVTVAGYVAPSTIQTISTGSVRVHQSSAADLNVTVAGYVAPSTTVQVSSVGGQVSVVPITSSGLELTTNATPASTAEGVIVRQVDYVAPSTTVQVSSVGGQVSVVPITSSGANMTDSTQASLRVTIAEGAPGGSTQVSISSGIVQVQNITSSGASMTDSTQASLRVTIAEGAPGGSTQVSISSGIIQVQHITSSGAQMTTNVEPASTSYGLITRLAPTTLAVSSVAGRVLVDQNSTVWPVQVSSVAGQVSVVPITSSGLELTTNATPGSTAEGIIVRQVDYVAPSTIQTISTGSVRVHQSSAADLNVTVAGYTAPSTIITVSSLSAFAPALVSSGDPVIGQQGLLVEANPINTTYVSGTLSSAESTVVAAISTSAFCVFGITLSVPPTSSQTVRVVAASTNEKYRVFYHSTTVSAGSVDNVTPPHYLFKTAANQSLAITSSGGTANVTYTLKYYEEG